jgi:hypothetical protein
MKIQVAIPQEAVPHLIVQWETSVPGWLAHFRDEVISCAEKYNLNGHGVKTSVGSFVVRIGVYPASGDASDKCSSGSSVSGKTRPRNTLVAESESPGFRRKQRPSVSRQKKALQAELMSSSPRILPSQALSGFVSTSKLIVVTNHDLNARYIGSKDEGMYRMQGVVTGNGHLEHHPSYGGRYFALKMGPVRNDKGVGDGLAIGVTTSAPHELIRNGSPTSITELRTAWAFGFDRLFWDGPRGQFGDIEWNTTDLRHEDTVGMLVEENGTVIIFQNNDVVHIWEGDIPANAYIYPLIDLLGSANEVSLMLGAGPPPP